MSALEFPSREFDAAIAALLGGQLTKEQSVALGELLREDREARAAYLWQTELHGRLATQDAFACPTKKSTDGEGSIIPMPAAPCRVSYGPWLALAATVLLFAGLVWWLGRDLGGVTFDVVSASEVPFQAGDRKRQKVVALERGSLRFRLPSGVVLETAGPSTIELVDAMHARVLRGNLVADVGSDGKGFVVDTPNARVVDLGTRFAVSVMENGETGVAVLQGEVELFAPGGSKSAERLAGLGEGEGVRVDSRQQLRRLDLVALRAGRPDFASAAEATGSVVRRVWDDARAEDSRKFYTLLPGGMAEGTRPYFGVNRARWVPMRGEAFPYELRGADAIGTFSMDRRNASRKIYLEVSGPCEVYVIVDSRDPIPDWLRQDFKETGMRVRSGPWAPDSAFAEGLSPDPNGHTYIVYSVWRRDVASAGEIVLGPATASGSGGARSMYGIAVRGRN